MKYLAIIPARGGSKGIKDKNLQLVANKSLLRRAIESVLPFMEVVVSTDSERIKSEAIKYGAKVPFLRPKEISNDSAKSIDVAIHAVRKSKINSGNYDYVFFIEPTSPFRNSNNIAEAINKIKENKYSSLISVCDLERKPENIFLKENYLSKYIKEPKETFEQRQSMKHLCRLNSAIYIVKKDLMINHRNFLIEPIGYIEMSNIESINIDTMLDLKFANFIAKELSI